MYEIIKDRKAKFKKSGVADIETYTDVTGISMPRLLVFIDNFDASKELEAFYEFSSLLIQLTREGINLGIHVVIGASKVGEIRYNILSNIKHKTSFFVIDKADVSQVVGRTQLEVEEVPGRAIIKMDEPIVYQGALPYDGDNKERLALMREFGKQYKENWKGSTPTNIDVVPEDFTIENYIGRENVAESLHNPVKLNLGLFLSNVENCEVDLEKVGKIQIAYDIEESSKTIINSIIKTSKEKMDITIYDSEHFNYMQFQNETEYIPVPELIVNHVKETFNEYRRRKELSKEELVDLKPILIIFTDPDAFIKKVLVDSDGDNDEGLHESMIDILNNGKAYRIYSVWNIDVSLHNKLNNTLGKYIREINTAVLTTKIYNRPSQIIVNQNASGEKELGEYEYNYITNGKFGRIKVPK